MELVTAIKGRRSIRKFIDKVIDHKIIEQIIEETSYSPSWKHTQTPRYIYLENRELIKKISEDMILGFEMNKDTICGCSGVMVVAYVTKRAGYERDGSFSTPKGDRFEMFDAGVASQTLCLSAHDKGIATVITGYFDEDKIIDLLQLDDNLKIASLICMGYGDQSPEAPKRKSVDQLISYIK